MYMIVVSLTVVHPVKSMTAAGDVNGDRPTRGEEKNIVLPFYFCHKLSFTVRVSNADSFCLPCRYTLCICEYVMCAYNVGPLPTTTVPFSILICPIFW